MANSRKSSSFIAAAPIHETLVWSFKEDFAKYARGGSQVEHLKLIWDRIPFEIGRRIGYSKLAGLQSRSADVSRAFDVLHDAMLVERILPTRQTHPPLVKKAKVAPKAIPLDIGLCVKALCLTRDQINQQLVDPFYRGGLSEVFVGQELLASDFYNRNPLFFWIREEKGASSELDFLLQVDKGLLPVEVKSGSHGSLKSLHQFLSRSGYNLGVRIYNNGSFKLENHSVTLPTGKNLTYRLLSTPLYLTFRLFDYLNLCG